MNETLNEAQIQTLFILKDINHWRGILFEYADQFSLIKFNVPQVTFNLEKRLSIKLDPSQIRRQSVFVRTQEYYLNILFHNSNSMFLIV